MRDADTFRAYALQDTTSEPYPYSVEGLDEFIEHLRTDKYTGSPTPNKCALYGLVDSLLRLQERSVPGTAILTPAGERLLRCVGRPKSLGDPMSEEDIVLLERLTDSYYRHPRSLGGIWREDSEAEQHQATAFEQIVAHVLLLAMNEVGIFCACTHVTGRGKGYSLYSTPRDISYRPAPPAQTEFGLHPHLAHLEAIELVHRLELRAGDDKKAQVTLDSDGKDNPILFETFIEKLAKRELRAAVTVSETTKDGKARHMAWVRVLEDSREREGFFKEWEPVGGLVGVYYTNEDGEHVAHHYLQWWLRNTKENKTSTVEWYDDGKKATSTLPFETRRLKGGGTPKKPFTKVYFDDLVIYYVRRVQRFDEIRDIQKSAAPSAAQTLIRETLVLKNESPRDPSRDPLLYYVRAATMPHVKTKSHVEPIVPPDGCLSFLKFLRRTQKPKASGMYNKVYVVPAEKMDRSIMDRCVRASSKYFVVRVMDFTEVKVQIDKTTRKPMDKDEPSIQDTVGELFLQSYASREGVGPRQYMAWVMTKALSPPIDAMAPTMKSYLHFEHVVSISEAFDGDLEDPRVTKHAFDNTGGYWTMLARCIAHTSTKGLVHGDLKRANLVFKMNGESVTDIKCIDFDAYHVSVLDMNDPVNAAVAADLAAIMMYCLLTETRCKSPDFKELPLDTWTAYVTRAMHTLDLELRTMTLAGFSNASQPDVQALCAMMEGKNTHGQLPAAIIQSAVRQWSENYLRGGNDGDPCWKAVEKDGTVKELPESCKDLMQLLIAHSGAKKTGPEPPAAVKTRSSIRPS